MFTISFVLIYTLTLNIVSGLNNSNADNIPVHSNLTEENNLWVTILRDCEQRTASCISKKIYDYLKKTDVLDYTGNIQFSNYLKISRNSVGYDELSMPEKELNKAENALPQFNTTPHIEELSTSFNDNAVNFLMAHNFELKLPDTFFLGTMLKVSPRSLEDNGALIKFEFLPNTITPPIEEGRLFKKIRQFISQRLIYALLAILLVIKLLAVKLLFVLPTIVGVAAAKKLLLKVLLFIFPALHHLFKLCAYVPHGAKHHIHKHQISHIHEIGHDSHYGHVGHRPHHKLYVEDTVPHIKDTPYFKSDKNHHDTIGGVNHLTSFGPYYEKKVIDHRLDHRQEDNGLWGYGPSQVVTKTTKTGHPLKTNKIEDVLQKTKYDSLMKEHLKKERQKIQGNLHFLEQQNMAVKIHDNLKRTTNLHVPKISHTKFTHYTKNNSNTLTPNQLLQASFSPPSVSSLGVHLIQQPIMSGTTKSQIHSLQNPLSYEYGISSQLLEEALKNINYSGNVVDGQQHMYEAVAVTYDAFYSPILEKIDRILIELGFVEEPCKEMLICSMYRDPSKYSPQSNLISAELSRDSKDLEKPSSNNAAAIRFYRYVQAARDGQDRRNCMRLYPACALNIKF